MLMQQLTNPLVMYHIQCNSLANSPNVLLFTFTDMESNLMCPFNESFSCKEENSGWGSSYSILLIDFKIPF